MRHKHVPLTAWLASFPLPQLEHPHIAPLEPVLRFAFPRSRGDFSQPQRHSYLDLDETNTCTLFKCAPSKFHY